MRIGDVLPFMDYITNKLLNVECGQVFASWFPVVMEVNEGVDGTNVTL